MGAASAKADRLYGQRKPGESKGISRKEEVNTNVFLVNFAFIQDKTYSVESNNLPQCVKCLAYFNKYSQSHVISREAALNDLERISKNLSPADVEKLQAGNEESCSVWFCDFCQTPKVISNIKQFNITSDFTLLDGHFPFVQKVVETTKEEKKDNELNAGSMMIEGSNDGTQQQLIYVLDNSGSMSSVERYMKDNVEVRLSRKKSIIAAIQDQAEAMIKNATEGAKKDMSVVIFSDLVHLYTQIEGNPEILSGTCLQNWDELIARVTGLSDKIEGTQPENVEFLLDLYRKNNKMGSTALGPAVLAAIEVAKAKSGSQIVVCTDGAANTGLGSLSQDPQISSNFYLNVANYAKDKGVQVSILGIGDEPIGLKQIGKLAEITSGSIFKIDLGNLKSGLDSIMADSMIASDVKLNLILHSSVKLDPNSNTQTELDVGNASKETCLTFEYIFGDSNAPSDVPFQAQIEYIDMNNRKQLIIATKIVETSDSRQAAEEGLNMDIIQRHMAQKSAGLVQKGEMDEVNTFQNKWADFVETKEAYGKYGGQIQQQQQLIQKIAVNQISKDKRSEDALEADLLKMKKGKLL